MFVVVLVFNDSGAGAGFLMVVVVYNGYANLLGPNVFFMIKLITCPLSLLILY